MKEREKIIRLWFDMWLQKKDLGLADIFTEDAVYIESWGPEYHGSAKIKLWFDEWNARGTVHAWTIQQFFHQDGQTVAEWYFKNQMRDGTVEEFDGMSLVKWAEDGRIRFLQEFGCNLNRYDPYQSGPVPQFQGGGTLWF